MTKFCKEIADALCEALRKGHTYESAADVVGIHYDTFLRWRKEGEGKTCREKVQFLLDVKRAEGSMITECLDIVKQAADKGQWQAGAWLLERRHWRKYGKPADQELNERMEKLEKESKNV
jgi:hypothetical protein